MQRQKEGIMNFSDPHLCHSAVFVELHTVMSFEREIFE